MNKLLSLVLLIFFLSACSSTKVHVNHRYIDNQTLRDITSTLEQAGFEVETNEFAFPNNISQSTVVYSPMISNKDAVNNIQDLLAQRSWHVPGVQPLVSGKHWFTKDSIGLYLLPEGINPHNRSSKADLVNVYQSRNCETEASISLSEDGKFEIALAQAVDDDRSLKGTWFVRNYPVLELKPDDDLWPWYFELSNDVEVDQISAIEITELTPLDQYVLFRGCHFVAGTRA